MTAEIESRTTDFTVWLYDAQDPAFALPAIRLGRKVRRIMHSGAFFDVPQQREVDREFGDSLSQEVVRALVGLRDTEPVRSVGALVLRPNTKSEDAVAYALASEVKQPCAGGPGVQQEDTYVMLQAVCVHPDYMADWGTARSGMGLSAIAATSVLSQFPQDMRLGDLLNATKILLHGGFEVGPVRGRGISGHSGDDVLPEDPQIFSRSTSPLETPIELSESATVRDALSAIYETYPSLPTFVAHPSLREIT